MKTSTKALHFLFFLLVFFLGTYFQAAAATSTYYLPVFQPPPGYWSGLGITNLSDYNPANVTIRIYSQSGAVSGTITKTIPAKGQDSFVVGQSVTQTGWMKITSDQKLAGLNLLGQYKGTTKNYYLADVPFTDIASKSLIIPHVGQNTVWDTTVYVANTEATAGTVTLTYINKAGVATTPHTVSIPANGAKEIPVSTIGKSTNLSGGYVTISSTRNLTAFALYKNLKTGNLSYAGINAFDTSVAASTYNYYLPVFKPRPAHWSGLGITNLNTSSPATVNVRIYDQNGAVLGNQTQSIVSRGQESFMVGSALTKKGWLKVSSNQPLAGMNLLGQYIGATKNYYLADVPFTNIASKSLIIPHVGQNAVWDTTVYVANTEAAAATVTLTYINKAGVATTPHTVSIPANGAKEIPVSTIGKSNNISGGYVTISSTKNLTAFALYNNIKTGNFSYAGINATPYPSKLENDVTYYLGMISSTRDSSDMMDEISALLQAVMEGDSSVVKTVPATIDPNNMPSSVKITADFGTGYKPPGSSSVYTGKAVINITNITFSQTQIKATVGLTATNIKRDGQLILTGAMSLGINVGISGSNAAVTVNCTFTNLKSMDLSVNGKADVSIPSMNTETGAISKPVVLTFTQFSTQAGNQISGTAQISQTGLIYEALFNLTTSQGPIVGTLRFDSSTEGQTIISTPKGALKAGGYTLLFNNVIMKPESCAGMPVGGNIVANSNLEKKTITFKSNCTYTIN